MDSLFEAGRKKRRPNFSVDFKKSVAQRACEPGVSVSQLAQGNGINVNMVFKWRREFLAGLFDTPTRPPPQVMLPVCVEEASAGASALLAKRRGDVSGSAAENIGLTQLGMIEVHVGETMIRFDSHADLTMLHAVVKMLRT